MVFLSHTLSREWCRCSRVSCFRITLLNTAMLEKAGSKACASQNGKTITNHNSIGACKIHSTITNCPKQKYSPLYKQVLLIVEGYHESNHKEMFLLRAYKTAMDIAFVFTTGIILLGRAKQFPSCHIRLLWTHVQQSAALHRLQPLSVWVHMDYSMFLNELKA